MVTKRGMQASREAAARKYGFLEAPYLLYGGRYDFCRSYCSGQPAC
ncbi:MAG: hypothetical protein Q8K59_09610 [Nitrosomonas sp.]|nr:hypothetical protein [Nitrosomonas sp.]MDP1951329.1 hypothetical protein [Nitrosomonas sp.]